MVTSVKKVSLGGWYCGGISKTLHEKHETGLTAFSIWSCNRVVIFDWANSVVQRMKTQSSIKYMYNQWSQFYHNECRNRLWNFREQDSRSIMMALQRLGNENKLSQSETGKKPSLKREKNAHQNHNA